MSGPEIVVVKIEVGHRATLKPKETPDGHTHDWTVFVRGAEGNNIEHIIDKVIFFLHKRFPKPKRVVKEPPFSVAETGYDSFTMPIDVYFKSSAEPKKIRFHYDLYVKVRSTFSNIRLEKMTFKNPAVELRQRLLKAGGVVEAEYDQEKKKSRGGSCHQFPFVSKLVYGNYGYGGPMAGGPPPPNPPAPGTENFGGPGMGNPAAAGPGTASAPSTQTGPTPTGMGNYAQDPSNFGPTRPGFGPGYGAGPNNYNAGGNYPAQGNYGAPVGGPDASRAAGQGQGYHPYHR